MANRHSHKKLRADIQQRMAATGESYQGARQRILLGEAGRVRGGGGGGGGAELVAASYFGIPVLLATFETLGRRIFMRVPGAGCAVAAGQQPLHLILWPRGVQ